MTTESRTESKQNMVLRMVLLPLARFCLRNSYSFQAFMGIAKESFIDAAEETLKNKNEKVNISRLGVLTGINRDEVARIYRNQDKEPQEYSNIPDKVLSHWGTDRRFNTTRGKPRILSYGGEESEFYQLVRSVTRSVHPSAVAFQLKQQGAVVEAASGLKMVAYLRAFSQEPQAALQVVGNDLSDLLLAGEENVFSDADLPNLHIRTSFDNVIPEARAKIRSWLIEQGKAYHKRVRNYLARFDKDLNPELEGKQGKMEVVFSTFSLTREAEGAGK